MSIEEIHIEEIHREAEIKDKEALLQYYKSLYLESLPLDILKTIKNLEERLIRLRGYAL